MRTLISAFAAAAAVATPLSALSLAAPSLAAQASAPTTATASVKIDNFVFGPAVLTVKVGTTVTWTNNDDVPHAVVADDHTTFKSKVLDTDQTFSFTFTKPGEYPYFCSIHPHMTGKVVVQG